MKLNSKFLHFFVSFLLSLSLVDLLLFFKNFTLWVFPLIYGIKFVYSYNQKKININHLNFKVLMLCQWCSLLTGFLLNNLCNWYLLVNFCWYVGRGKVTFDFYIFERLLWRGNKYKGTPWVLVNLMWCETSLEDLVAVAAQGGQINVVGEEDLS